MTSNEILKADIIDILFDNRNKQYGAYTLRKNYNSRLSVALGISLSSVLLIFFLLRTNGHSHVLSDNDDKGTVIIDQIILPNIKKPDPIIPKHTMPAPVLQQRTLSSTIIKEDRFVKNPMASQTDLISSLISNHKADGIADNNIPVIKETIIEKQVKEESKKVEITPSREPEFPGGQEAWLNFLRKNLIAPEELELGDKKTVSIRFFVSADGTVTGFEVLQSAGKIFDNEVIRVLKKMPKWKPAIQNGQTVSKAFTQPVTFIGVEQ